MKLKKFIAFLSIRSIGFICGFIFVIFNCFKVDAQTGIDQDLVFGTFSTNGLPGTITIKTDGTIKSTGGITYSSGSYQHANLHVDFHDNSSSNHIDITYPHGQFLTGSNGGTISVTLSPAEGRYSMNGYKQINLAIGGTLTIDNTSKDPPGSYSGTITVKCYINNQ